MALEMYDFIRNTKPDHLTILDLKKINIGDELDVVIWDGHFEEYWIWNNAENMKPYHPHDFFEKNHCKLIYKGNLTWDLHIDREIFEHPIHLDLSYLKTSRKWYEINNDGYININKIPKHWTEFPDTTRIGWRGPIMLWDKLINYPNVYNRKNFYGDKISKNL